MKTGNLQCIERLNHLDEFIQEFRAKQDKLLDQLNNSLLCAPTVMHLKKDPYVDSPDGFNISDDIHQATCSDFHEELKQHKEDNLHSIPSNKCKVYKDETETIYSMQTSKYGENGEQSFLSVESGEQQNLIFKGKPSSLSKKEEPNNSLLWDPGGKDLIPKSNL